MWKLVFLIFVGFLGTSMVPSVVNGQRVSVDVSVAISTDATTQSICGGAYNRFKHAIIYIASRILQVVAEKQPQTSVTVAPLVTAFIIVLHVFHSTGTTQIEIFQAFGFITRDEVNCVLLALQEYLVDLPPGFEIYAVGDIFANLQYTFTPEFKSNVAKYIFGETRILNFADSENSANEINELIATQTENNINEVIYANNLNSTNELVIASGVYIKSDWLIRFTETREDVFTVSECERVPTTYMCQDQVYRYVDSIQIGAKVIEIPLIDTNFVNLIILPNRGVRIEVVLEKLSNYVVYNTVYESLRLTRTHVCLPPIEVLTNTNTRQVVVQTRIVPSFFTREASFVNIVRNNIRAMYSVAYQTCRIIFTANGGDPPTGALPSNRVEFNANRPFLIYTLVGGIPSVVTQFNKPEPPSTD